MTVEETNALHHAVYLVGMTLISTAIIYLSWGNDAPIYNFALTFGGVLLGHVLTEALNTNDEEV